MANVSVMNVCYRRKSIRYSSYPSTESSWPSECSDDGQISRLCNDLDSFNFRTIDHFDPEGKLVTQVETCVRSVTDNIEISIPATTVKPKKVLPPRAGTKAHKGHKPWMTTDTLRLIRIRDMLKASLGHRPKNDPLELIQYEMFKKARNSVVTLCRNARAEFFEDHPEEKQRWENARQQWAQVNPCSVNQRRKSAPGGTGGKIDYSKKKVWPSSCSSRQQRRCRSDEVQCWRKPSSEDSSICEAVMRNSDSGQA